MFKERIFFLQYSTKKFLPNSQSFGPFLFHKHSFQSQACFMARFYELSWSPERELSRASHSCSAWEQVADNLSSLLRTAIIIVVCTMLIIISIIVRGIYVMFMIIVYRVKPGSFCRLRAYEALVLLAEHSKVTPLQLLPYIKMRV